MKTVLSVSWKQQADSSGVRNFTAEGGFLPATPQPSSCCARGPEVRTHPKAFQRQICNRDLLVNF